MKYLGGTQKFYEQTQSFFKERKIFASETVYGNNIKWEEKNISMFLCIHEYKISWGNVKF